MSEYTTIWEAVRFGTLKDVIEIFKKGDEKIGDASGDSILFDALANTNSIARYEITNFLINKGADVKIIREDGISMFFPLFSYGRRDIIKMTILCKTLLEKGADITTIYKEEKTVSFKGLFNIGTPEIEMLPLYQLIFSQPGLPLLVKDKWGLTLLDFAKKAERYIGVKYIEDYIRKYNLTNEQF